MFVDRVEIEVVAGNGGDGCLSFRRQRYVPMGGPDGGNGGNGGSILIKAQEGVDNLTSLARQKRWRADKGRHGSGSNRQGRGGSELVLYAPAGTVVMDAKQQFVIKDLAEAGDSLIAARGGKGGRGNASFKSSTNRAPRQVTKGETGEHRFLLLELKMIADVGLIGKPNAGKSTLLSRLTHARPQVADYPFTTKHPHLGLVQIDIDRSFVMADIPGLIEGASQGAGLGHEFLRHVQRASILVHLVEPQPLDGSDPCENYLRIRDELIQYNEQLGQRPEVIVISKAELPGATEARDEFAAALGRDAFLISSVTGQGLNQLTRAISELLRERTERCSPF